MISIATHGVPCQSRCVCRQVINVKTSRLSATYFYSATFQSEIFLLLISLIYLLTYVTGYFLNSDKLGLVSKQLDMLLYVIRGEIRTFQHSLVEGRVMITISHLQCDRLCSHIIYFPQISKKREETCSTPPTLLDAKVAPGSGKEIAGSFAHNLCKIS